MLGKISGDSDDITDHPLIKYCGSARMWGEGGSTVGQFLLEKLTNSKCPAEPNTLYTHTHVKIM
jgi:hypothetical protein